MNRINDERTVYVSTIIDSHNYGTVMQAVATRDLLSGYGNPVFVDYCRPQWTRKGWAALRMSNKSHSKVFNLLRVMGGLGTRLRSERVFRPFVTRELSLCDATPFLTGQGIEDLDHDAVFCVGSDQTWNIECNSGIDPVYFLRHIPSDRKKISLAASFGRDSISEEEASLTRSLLKEFGAISVRESSSVRILEGMGITGSVALKDPVLLCDSMLWKRLSEYAEAPCKGDYVLTYMLNPNPDLCSYASQVAKDSGMQCYSVSFNPFKRSQGGIQNVCLPKPEEWLALFRGASLVVTDSFHGTCFSLLFGKPMVVFDPPKYSVRLRDVLSDFGLEGRRVLNMDDALTRNLATTPIDWDKVNRLISEEQARARDFLAHAFGC